jgi:hypothetical protein
MVVLIETILFLKLEFARIYVKEREIINFSI